MQILSALSRLPRHPVKPGGHSGESKIYHQYNEAFKAPAEYQTEQGYSGHAKETHDHKQLLNITRALRKPCKFTDDKLVAHRTHRVYNEIKGMLRITTGYI